MKNISFYKIAFLIAPLFLIFSCAKEKDITTTTPNNPGPIENTDIYTVQGIVKDTTDQPIGGASLKAYFDDLEIEATSDMDGNYEFKIPKSKTEGYIVAAKERYDRAISSVQLNSNTLDKSIYLVRNFSNNTQNLKLSTDSLLTIRGRTVDETGQPIEGSNILFIGYNSGTTFSIGTIGFTDTDEQGNFELIVYQGDYWARTLSAKYPSECGTRYGTNWSDEEPLKELGDIVLDIGTGTERVLTTTVGQTDCGSTDGLVKLYMLDFRTFLTYEKPLGTYTYNYCDKQDSTLVFVGTHSPDKQEFNGQFYTATDLPVENNFDICTPTGYFFEIYKNGVLETGENGNVETFSGNITLSTATNNYVFLAPTGRTLKTIDQVVKIETGILQGLITLDSNNNTTEEYQGSTSGLFYDYIENSDDTVAGIIQGKMEENGTGTINEYFIRFRMPKQ